MCYERAIIFGTHTLPRSMHLHSISTHVLVFTTHARPLDCKCISSSK